jgi:hypothetical protein
LNINYNHQSATAIFPEIAFYVFIMAFFYSAATGGLIEQLKN